MQPIITIFTTPKPFKDAHIRTIQTNAIRSWALLKPAVEVVLIGEEEGVAEAADQAGVLYLPEVKRNQQGTPLISSLFSTGASVNTSPLLAYVNADILLFDDFLSCAQEILSQSQKFLIVGQRWDLNLTSLIDFSEGWQRRIKQQTQQEGWLHTRGGSDYFIYPRVCFQKIPDFAVGRAGWDNWMFYEARRQGWKTIDATPSIQIVHQNHDYSHLPGGQTHYRLPETTENVRLAGGRRTIFTLMDVDYEFRDGIVKKYPLSLKKLLREIEIFPLVRLNSMGLGHLFFAVFHPKQAVRELKKWAAARRKK
ncbi:MAG: hypothetical protein CL609_09395 [Anaerolineaceae bacterium]|nr:hypothetical protein [Anaerolineaceae bacterium]